MLLEKLVKALGYQSFDELSDNEDLVVEGLGNEAHLLELIGLQRDKIHQLNVQLSKRDEEIQNFEYRIEDIELGWALPDLDREDLERLPIPRFEVRWNKMWKGQDHWGSYRVIYYLVFKASGKNMVYLPQGWTKSTGSRYVSIDDTERLPWTRHEHLDGNPDLPTRLAVDLTHDANHFGLPAYAVTPDGTDYKLEMNTERTRHMANLGVHHRREI